MQHVEAAILTTRRKRRENEAMGFFDLFVIGIGLSMDAFAVSICKGLGMKRINWRHAFIIALFFGGFHVLMPLVGWALGTSFQQLIEPTDHWIAFILLVIVGGKMLWDAFHEEKAEDDVSDINTPDTLRLDLRELLMMAIATSIDVLAVGVTFALLNVNILHAVTIIGCTTFVLSLIGTKIGNQFGRRYEQPATIVGGIVLILIGLRILLEHLNIISF